MKQAIISLTLGFCLLCLWLLLRQDVVRWIRPSRRVQARVVGHRQGWDKGRRTYSARLCFDVEGQTYEVTDQMRCNSPEPPVDATVTMRFPKGRPDLARIPRPWTWAGVYLLFLWLAGMMIAKLSGWV